MLPQAQIFLAKVAVLSIPRRKTLFGFSNLAQLALSRTLCALSVPYETVAQPLVFNLTDVIAKPFPTQLHWG